ncbi:MAG: hypothetical protein EOM70_12675, partial [Clostridia bacterium]|nr:hypothetical protein [Clostridia bacterium]
MGRHNRQHQRRLLQAIPGNQESTRAAKECKKIAYPKPDGVFSFDRLSSVFLGNVHHEEDQPAHLKLRDWNIENKVNIAHYD